MSSLEDGFIDFVTSQIQLMDDLNAQIEKNALQYHLERCEDSVEGCADRFMELFLAAYIVKIKQAQASEFSKNNKAHLN